MAGIENIVSENATAVLPVPTPHLLCLEADSGQTGSLVRSHPAIAPRQRGRRKKHFPYQTKTMGIIIWYTMVHIWPIYGFHMETSLHTMGMLW